jgi:hypothetical protein
LRARGAELPLGAFAVAVVLQFFRRSGPALLAGTGPLRRVAEDRRAADREEPSSQVNQIQGMFDGDWKTLLKS